MVRNLWVGDFVDPFYLLFGDAFADENHDCYDNAVMMMIFLAECLQDASTASSAGHAHSLGCQIKPCSKQSPCPELHTAEGREASIMSAN